MRRSDLPGRALATGTSRSSETPISRGGRTPSWNTRSPSSWASPSSSSWPRTTARSTTAADEPEELRGLQLEHVKRIVASDRIRMPFHSLEHLTDQVRVMGSTRIAGTGRSRRGWSSCCSPELLDA